MSYSRLAHSRLRDECLNEQVFLSLDDARHKIDQWRMQYNRERPHSSLGYLTPEEFAASYQQLRSEPAPRSAGPANRMLAGALHCATVSVEEPDRFSAQPQGQ
jgi:putative transposase